MGKSPLWTFAGYKSEAGGSVVQEWYDGLPIEEREELQDQLNLMAFLEKWVRPEFDKVTHPIHEIRVKANAANHHIRVYGVFSSSIRRQFVLLHGTMAKKRDRDSKGQEVALKRLSLLNRRKASIHEFAIENESEKQNQTKPGSPRKAGVIEFRQGDRLPDSRNER